MRARKEMERREFLQLFGGAAFTATLSGLVRISPVFAEDAFPAGKITWIVGQPPGGSLDLTARGAAPFLEKHLKAISRGNAGKIGVGVKTIEGGAEARALSTVYHAKPDGYTIAVATDKLHSGTILNELDFDLFELTFLARLGSASKVLVASTTSNIQTWNDVVQISKKTPVKIAIGGHGTSNHIAAIFLLDVTGLAAKIIQFKGTAGTNAALIRNDVHLLVNSEDSVLKMIESKQLRPLLTFSADSIYTTVPKAKDVGFPDLMESIKSQRYLVAPPGLPPATKAIMEDALRKTMADREFIAWREKAGISFDPVIGPELDKLVKDLHKFYKSREKILRLYILEQKS